MIAHYRDLEQALRERGEFICPIRGVSMLPMLEQDKDAVRLVPSAGRLKKYDLPLYRRADGALVLHRIIGVGTDHYLVRGDNCTMVEHIPFDAVIAVAIGYFKAGRYISCEDADYLRYAVKQVRLGAIRTVCGRGKAALRRLWRTIK